MNFRSMVVNVSPIPSVIADVLYRRMVAREWPAHSGLRHRDLSSKGSYIGLFQAALDAAAASPSGCGG